MLSVPRVQQFPQVAKVHAPFLNPVYSYKRFNRQSIESIKLQLSLQRVHTKLGKSNCGHPACAAAAEEANHDGESTPSTEIISLWGFPWFKFISKLMQNAADATWFLVKWIAVPALIVVAFRDVVFTVVSENELSIPIGLLMGTLFSGIIKETFSSLRFDFQHNVLPWHFVELGLFFMIVKACASNISPMWFRSFLLHFTTGGLWQTIRFSLDWKARNEQGIHDELNSVSV